MRSVLFILVLLAGCRATADRVRLDREMEAQRAEMDRLGEAERLRGEERAREELEWLNSLTPEQQAQVRMAKEQERSAIRGACLNSLRPTQRPLPRPALEWPYHKAPPP